MTISQIGFSGGEYYDVLTSPFLIKRVTVKSYTPYNEAKPAEEAFSRNDFPKIKSTYSARLHVKTHNVGVIDLSSNSADIVKEMISDGYSAMNALDINKAVNAYGLNALNNAGGVSTLSSNVYEV